MKKAIYLLLLAAICCPALLVAQTKENITTDAKIDSIYRLQKKMYVESKTGPLSNKTQGIEVNLFRLLIIDQAATFSGTYSLFNVNRQAELAFPFYIQQAVEKNDLSEVTLDCHYRYFLGKEQNGFYLSAFARFAYLHGTLGDNFIWYDPNTSYKTDSEGKLGVGFGIGYRKFSYRGLYWGMSLNMGRYIIGHNQRFMGNFLTLDDDEPFIVDVELLKFGWAF